MKLKRHLKVVDPATTARCLPPEKVEKLEKLLSELSPDRLEAFKHWLDHEAEGEEHGD